MICLSSASTHCTRRTRVITTAEAGEGDEEEFEVVVLVLEAVVLAGERVQSTVAQGEALAPQRSPSSSAS